MKVVPEPLHKFLYNLYGLHVLSASKNKQRPGGREVYPVNMDEETSKALKTIMERLHYSKAVAIRESIKHYADDVKGVQVVQLREGVSLKQAKKEVLEYLQKNGRSWSSDIALSLRLDVELVEKALQELWDQEEVEPLESRR